MSRDLYSKVLTYPLVSSCVSTWYVVDFFNNIKMLFGKIFYTIKNQKVS